MKKRISIDELSAHLDGEARDPGEVQRQLEESEALSTKYSELKEVGRRVRSLSTPELIPGFASRVIRAVEAPADRRRVAWRIPAGLSAAVATAAVALLVVLGSGAPTEVQAPTVALSNTMPQEDALIAELERRLVNVPAPEALLTAGVYEPMDPVEEDPDALLLALAPATWLEAFGGDDSGSDYLVALDELNDSERDIFRELLSEYTESEPRDADPREG